MNLTVQFAYCSECLAATGTGTGTGMSSLAGPAADVDDPEAMNADPLNPHPHEHRKSLDP